MDSAGKEKKSKDLEKKKWDYVKLKSFYIVKETVTVMKRCLSGSTTGKQRESWKKKKKEKTEGTDISPEVAKRRVESGPQN